MRFLTSYYWQEAEPGRENGTSLTLQQIRMKKGGGSLVLACVCNNRDFCGQLVDLLHEGILTGYGRKGCVDWDVVSHRLQGMAPHQGDGEKRFSCAGILCIGEEFLMFGQGKQRVYLLNRGFQKARIKMLMGEDAMLPKEPALQNNEGGALELYQGIMEPEVGLLLATEPFYEHLTEQMLKGCLGGGIRDDRQASRCLRELGGYGEDRGGRNLGAVFIHSLHS